MSLSEYGAYRLDVGYVGIDQARRHWRARISTLTGSPLGAGIVLDAEHVLTCAHILVGRAPDPPTQPVLVELVGLPDCPGCQATVAEGFWVPVGSDESGDIAVLQLTEPLSGAIPAPVQRMPLLHLEQKVRVFGYPEGAATGLWSEAVLAGDGGPRGELLQLRTDKGEAISRGFSGAAVIDTETDNVIGMVVGRRGSVPETTASWMIPVDVMIGYLPGLKAWVPGDPSVDASFVRQGDSSPRSVPFAREFAAWIAGGGMGEVRLVITGESGSDVATGLRLAVAMADRERPRENDRIYASVPRDAVPPQGSIDLAVDASGRTADEVRRRIAERLGPRHADEAAERHGVAQGVRALVGRPRALLHRVRTLVVDAVDDSAEPDSLVADVLQPLARRAADLGIRLVLGFRRENSPGLSTLRSTLDAEIAARLRLLDERVQELTDLEAGNAELQVEVERRLTGAPAAQASAGLLAAAVANLREQHATGDSDWVRGRFGDCEAAVSQAAEAASRVAAELDRMLAERDGLRALVELYWQRANDLGVADDPALAEGYRVTRGPLWEGRCDLSAAVGSVDRFAAQVRARAADERLRA